MDKKFVEKVRRDMNLINDSGYGTSIISDDYSQYIFDAIEEEVAQDIKECAAKEYNDDDVRLAVGRVLVKRLGIGNDFANILNTSDNDSWVVHYDIYKRVVRF